MGQDKEEAALSSMATVSCINQRGSAFIRRALCRGFKLLSTAGVCIDFCRDPSGARLRRPTAKVKHSRHVEDVGRVFDRLAAKKEALNLLNRLRHSRVTGVTITGYLLPTQQCGEV